MGGISMIYDAPFLEWTNHQIEQDHAVEDSHLLPSRSNLVLCKSTPQIFKPISTTLQHNNIYDHTLKYRKNIHERKGKTRGNYNTFTHEEKLWISKMCSEFGPTETANKLFEYNGQVVNKSTIYCIHKAITKANQSGENNSK